MIIMISKFSFFTCSYKKNLSASKKKIIKLLIYGAQVNHLREILYVDEVAEACEFFLRKKTKIY